MGALDVTYPASAVVAVAAAEATYEGQPPYGPGAMYPEYPFGTAGTAAAGGGAYGAVRSALRLLDLDAGRYGLTAWNPLGSLIRPGQTIVLKPNFVRDFRETQPGHGDCLITHGSIIRAVLDYVYIALGGQGRIVIADAPQNDADFTAIRRIAGLDEIQEFYRRHAGFEVEVYDLRPERARKIDGVIVGHEPLPGDPAGYVAVNLGRRSMFAEIEPMCHRLYGAEYDTGELRRHHLGGLHEYLICRTILQADCVISLPKLKTHKKTGLTVNLKNLVGINGNKNWLPHHREGTPRQGGDQFADDGWRRRLEQAAVAGFKRVFPRLGPLRRVLAGSAKSWGRRAFGDTNRGTVRSGNWHGNDTTWRMVLDLNRILRYADGQGRWHDRPVRRFLSVVDAIVAGEGNGPLDATPRPAGLVLAGANAVAVDLACARLMGFDFRRLPMLHRALEAHSWSLAEFAYGDVVMDSDVPAWTGRIADVEGRCLDFRPHFGWQQILELWTPAGDAAGRGGTIG